MGAEVTVVEVVDRILPAEDIEIAQIAHKAFEKQGMTIMTGAKVSAVRSSTSGAKVDVEDSKGKTLTLDVEKVILAVGIMGNVENIGLEGTKVVVDRGHVVVNEWLETGEPGVYAIGDLVGPPWLAHKASHEGVICVEKIAGLEHVEPLNTANIPGCTYCSPQIASIGMSEAAAKEAGHEIRLGRFPFMGNGKAIALGEAGTGAAVTWSQMTALKPSLSTIRPESLGLIEALLAMGPAAPVQDAPISMMIVQRPMAVATPLEVVLRNTNDYSLVPIVKADLQDAGDPSGAPDYNYEKVVVGLARDHQTSVDTICTRGLIVASPQKLSPKTIQVVDDAILTSFRYLMPASR